MSWFTNFLTSSIGKKLIMSLTGLFLILFLKVHLLGNLQLLKDDGGLAFNTYAHFMAHNPLIKFISYGNYFFHPATLYDGHVFVGEKIRSQGTNPMQWVITGIPTWSSRNMAILGMLVLAFCCPHMGDFWWEDEIWKHRSCHGGWHRSQRFV